MIDINKLISDANKMKEEFKRLSKDIPYEHKGILFSEMFFLSLCIKQNSVKRILESGRARGQSTLMLAKIFPDNPIISIEYDPHSLDVDIAQERLKDCKNISLKFGDPTKLLPEISKQGDVVLIDGPKGFRGVRLALKLLDSGKFPMVFLHDTTKGTVEREFLEKSLKGIEYSDNLKIASITSTLDDKRVDLPKNLRIDGENGYGFSLACIPFNLEVNYKLVLLKAVVRGALNRWFKR